MAANGRKLTTAASIIGTLQGFTWNIFAIVCIVLYCQPTITTIPKTYMSQVNYLMYGFFLAREFAPFPGQSLTPRVFFGFMWVYAIFNFTWMLVSLNLLRSNKKITAVIKAWGLLTLLMCFLDFVIVVLLGMDFKKCLEHANSISLEEMCTVGIFPVLLIAAKGYVLWIINLILAVVMCHIGKKDKKAISKLLVS